MAKIQSPIANPNPNSKTERGGLSSEGITYGITSEPKNNWPIPMDKSESLSNCVLDKTIFINLYNTTVC